MQQIQPPKLFDKIGLIILGTVWASAFISMRYLSEFINPEEIAFWRILIAVLLLRLIIKITKLKYDLKFADIKKATNYGLIGIATPFVILPYASTTLSAGIMTLIMSVGPFFAVLFAHTLTKDDKITLYKLIGIMIGFIGVSITIWDGIINGTADLFGGILVIIAAIFYTASSNTLRRAGHIPALIFLFYSLIISAIFLLFVLFITDKFSGFDNYNISFVWLNLIYLGFFPTGLSWWYRFNLTNKVGYSFASLVMYIIPVAGVILGYLILNEEITKYIFISLALILFSMWIFSYNKK